MATKDENPTRDVIWRNSGRGDRYVHVVTDEKTGATKQFLIKRGTTSPSLRMTESEINSTLGMEDLSEVSAEEAAAEQDAGEEQTAKAKPKRGRSR